LGSSTTGSLFVATCDDREYKIKIGKKQGDRLTEVWVDDRVFLVDICSLGRNEHFSVLLDHGSFEVTVGMRNGRRICMLGGIEYEVAVEDETTHRVREMGIAGEEEGAVETVKAPMPGLIIAIPVKKGDYVEKNTRVAVMEAMKMENELVTKQSGLVSEVFVEVGDNVDQGDIIINLTRES